MGSLRLVARVAFFALLAWASTSAPGRAAPPTLKLNEDTSYTSLRPYVEAYEERGNALTIDSVRSQTFGPPVNLFTDVNTTYWLRFRYTTVPGRRYFVFLGYKPSFADLYVQLPNGSFDQRHSGGEVPFADRPIHDYGVIELALPAAPSTTTAYLRIRSFEPSTALSVESGAMMAAADSGIIAVAIALCSVLTMLFLMSLVLLFMLKRAVYAYYSLYLLAQVFYKANDSGLTSAFLWPHAALSWIRSDSVFDGITLISATLFVRAFLDLRKYSVVLDNANIAVAVIGALYTIAAAFGMPIRITLVWDFAFIYVPLWIITSAYCWRHGHPRAKFLLLAWSALMVGQLLLDIKNFGLAPSQFILLYFFSYGPYVGLTLECMLITMMLSFDAQREYAVKLEDEVAERTRQLNEAMRTMEATNRELETFSYAVSHDLRAPLRAISGFAGALGEDYGEAIGDKGMRLIGRVNAGVTRMMEMIEALLGLAVLARSEVQPEPVDVSALARDLCDELLEAYPGRSVTTIVQDGMMATGDRRLLGNLLQNLLGNALKFTSKQDDARIEVGETVRDGQRTFFVRDNGVGFDMQHASKLFGPFQRLHKNDAFEGTGIGLATAQRIVHKHGGAIWAESSTGEGAAFFFVLGT